MINWNRLSLVVFYLVSFGNVALGQVDAQDDLYVVCEPAEVNEIVMAFGENREKFQTYICIGQLKMETIPFHIRASKGSSKAEFSIIDDHEKRRLRRDWRETLLMSEESAFEPWISDIQIPGKKSRSIGHQDISHVYIEGTENEVWTPGDIWTMTISDWSSVIENHCHALRWMDILDSRKLLASQKYGSITRGEWSYGSVGARIQVYFDHEYGNMPVFCRVIIPPKDSPPFTRNTRLLLNEIESKWEKHQGGWVPVRVINQRDNFEKNGDPVVTFRWQFKFNWSSTLKVRDEMFHGDDVTPWEIYESVEMDD